MYDCRTPSSAHGAVARLLAATMLALSWIVPGSAFEPYARVVIAEPENRATVHDRAGAVQVRVIVDPPLRATAGHQIRVRLDDRVLRVAWSSASFPLEDVDRGQHTMQVLVTDARGVILAESAPVQFRVQPGSTSPAPQARTGGR